MSPWPWISSLGRASIEGSLLILGVWLVSRAWPTLPAWARSGLWWLASARLLVALAPWTAISISTPVPLQATWWTAAMASPPSAAPASTAHGVAAGAPIPAQGLTSSWSEKDPAARSARVPRRRFDLLRLDARSLALGLLWVWALGVLVRLAGMARQFARVRRMRQAAAGAEVLANLDAMPGVRLALHEEVPAPMVTGLLRPWVLLPAAMVREPGDELRLAVAHELSHVRRGDLWLAWIPALAEALFWFHPLVSLCAREYVQACEEACDEDALRTTGAHPYEYGRLLLALGVDRRWLGAGAIAFGSPTPRQLVRRLSMLQHVAPSHPRARTAALSLVCAFALLGLAPVRVVPAAGAPKLAKVLAPISAPHEAVVAAGEAPAEAAALAPGAAAVTAFAMTASATPAPAGAMEKDPAPPDDPEVTPSPDDDGEDLDRGADLDDDDPAGDLDDDDDDDGMPAVPPVPPQAPRVARPPRPPHTSVPPVPATAPRARFSERGVQYSYSYDEADDPSDRFAYVLVHGGDESMSGSGSTMDWSEVRRLRARLGGDFLWVRLGNRKYVIEDPDVLARVEEAFKPQTEIGNRQSRLGEAQSQIGEQQSKIGEAQSRIGEAQSEIGQRQAELAARMVRRQASGEDTRDLERMASRLSDQMEELSRQQSRLATQMEPFSRQQEELGSRMEALAHQMERVSRTASREVRGMIERAIRDGDAKPLR